MKKLQQDEPLNSGSSKKRTGVAWHPAFVQALRIELYDYRDVLEFFSEYELYSEPLRIDCLIVKKEKDAVIGKTIATGFREWNIIEYKSPGDNISVLDYYKVYAYACLCVSGRKAPLNELTITFVGSRYPRDLIRHLREERGYTVEKTAEGVYTVSGDVFPVQIIASRELPAEGNLWLKSLSNRLDVEEVVRISEAMARQDRSLVGIYTDVISRTNAEKIQEAIEMSRRLTIEQVFQNVGWIDKWQAEGEAKGEARGKVIGFAEGRLEIAQRMKSRGRPLAEIAEDTGLSPEEIAAL